MHPQLMVVGLGDRDPEGQGQALSVEFLNRVVEDVCQAAAADGLDVRSVQTGREVGLHRNREVTVEGASDIRLDDSGGGSCR